MNIKDLKDILWQFITEATGLEVIFADTTEDRPKLPYGTIKILTIPKGSEHPDVRMSVEDGKYYRNSERTNTLTLSVNLYGADSVARASNFRDAFDTEEMRFKLGEIALPRGLDIIVLEMGAIQDLSSLVESKYEERSQFDVVFRFSSTIKEEANWIEKLKDLKQTYKHEAGAVKNETTEDVLLT